MKLIKSIASLMLSLVLLFTVGAHPAFAAEGEGWIEIQVSVPENFSDQIYVQFQEEGKYEEAFSGNSVQVIPENGYVGRIKLPAGTYEISMMTVFEHPLVYKVELSPETEQPIIVKSDSAATLVKLDCTVYPIEELPELEEGYPPEIVEAAQKASDEAKQKEEIIDESEKITDIENNPEESVSSELTDNSAEETKDGPLMRMAKGLFSSVFFFGIISLIIFILYKSKRN